MAVKNKLDSIFRGMIYVLPVVLFFSYQPLIALGSNGAMNFELSLPLIWLVVFDVLAVVMMLKRKIFWRGLKNKWLWLLFPLFLTLSVIWSLNPLRGFLTVGILWLIYLAIYGFWSLKDLFKDVSFKEKFWKVFFGSALMVCVWCWLQCVLDLVGVGRDYSLMCAGCVYEMFGFPRVNGFAIEPQFMGNLLLAPTIISGWLILRKDSCDSIFRGRVARARRHGAHALILGRNLRKPLKTLFPTILLFVFTATLFLTMSRGAIYAFLVAMVMMTIVMMVRTKKARALLMWPVIILGFLFTLNAQGIMAQASKTDDTYLGGMAKVLNHLTLGVIDIDVDSNESTEVIDGDEAVFDGYVAESTDTRIRLSDVAIQTWAKDFPTIMFGVGLGGAGQALYVNGLSPAPKEIVQNQYASLLLETGIIGILLLILTLVLVVRAVWKSPIRLMIFTLIIAYAVSLCFFSGLPNALQIYLLPGLFLAIKTPKNS